MDEMKGGSAFVFVGSGLQFMKQPLEPPSNRIKKELVTFLQVK